ncbi:MAG: aminotransferase class I/II-fold pyridoxal phosphate-dependent enzyme, partial [Bacteroidota bacterium]
MSSPVFPFQSSIDLKKNGSKPIYLQLADGLAQLIKKGRLKSDYKLPGSRQMAELMNLHRKTVIASYNELISQGWAVTYPSKGTYVINKLPVDYYRSLDNQITSAKADAPFWFKKRNHLLGEETEYRNHLIVDEGTPDVRLAPLDLITRAYNSIVKRGYQYKYLSYADPRGDVELRNQLQNYLQSTRGISAPIEQILITRGSQMGIYLASHTLIESGDNIVVGETNYINTNLTFKDAGATLITCTVDDQGLDTTILE